MRSNLNDSLNRISDLALATTLSLYSPIHSIESTDGSRVIFVFKKTAEIDHLVDSFWIGSLRIEPQQFFNQLKVIKARIHNQT